MPGKHLENDMISLVNINSQKRDPMLYKKPYTEKQREPGKKKKHVDILVTPEHANQ
jgi:hypothetical protein